MFLAMHDEEFFVSFSAAAQWSHGACQHIKTAVILLSVWIRCLIKTENYNTTYSLWIQYNCKTMTSEVMWWMCNTWMWMWCMKDCETEDWPIPSATELKRVIDISTLCLLLQCICLWLQVLTTWTVCKRRYKNKRGHRWTRRLNLLLVNTF